MKNTLNKVTRLATGIFAVMIGVVMAALGFTFMTFLAMFALAVVGLALIVKPFVASNQNKDDRFASVDFA